MDTTKIEADEGAPPQVRFGRSFAAEVEKRNAAIAAWSPIWAAGGIAFGYHAVMESRGGICLPSHPSHTIHGEEAGRLKVGDLVAVRDSGAPSDANQHIRRVVQTVPATPANPGGAALLGFAIPREQWPAPMRDATVAVGLEVEPVEGGLRILRNGHPVAALPLSEDEVNGWRGSMIGFIRNAARAGHADGLSERDRGFLIKPASGPEGRTWDVVDTSGTVHARDERSLLQRRPTPRAEILLLVTKQAHFHAYEVARQEDRDRTYEGHEFGRDTREIASESGNEPMGAGFGR